MSTQIPSAGDRISVNGAYGTVLYIGGVQGTKGTWLGVDWDDGTRGKHDGSMDGINYFATRSSTSGSFIRPTAHGLSLGRSLLEALYEKYTDQPQIKKDAVSNGQPGQTEMITLGSSNGAIQVEAVDLAKVRRKFARLDRLKEVGLEAEGISTLSAPHFATEGTGNANKDAATILARTCPNLQRLDLSSNLISSWQEIVTLTGHVHSLESLSLNYNRFKPLERPLADKAGGTNLRELRLNSCQLTWDQVLMVAPAFPSLRSLELGLCQMSNLQIMTPNLVRAGGKPLLPLLESLNFDTNELSDWAGVCTGIKIFPRLSRLILISNAISTISPLASSSSCSPLPSITSLSLQSNHISQWSDVDNLHDWLPNLENLGMADNPVLGKYSRLLLIGRLAGLKVVQGGEVTPGERRDAELFYLLWIVRNVPPERRAAEHPRWEELVRIHGAPAEEERSIDHGAQSLRKRLINVVVVPLSDAPQSRSEPRPSSIPSDTQNQIQVLPSMLPKALKLKLAKLLNTKDLRVWLWVESARREDVFFTDMKEKSAITHNGEGVWTEIELDGPKGKDLRWWGIEEYCTLGVLVL